MQNAECKMQNSCYVTCILAQMNEKEKGEKDFPFINIWEHTAPRRHILSGGIN